MGVEYRRKCVQACAVYSRCGIGDYMFVGSVFVCTLNSGARYVMYSGSFRLFDAGGSTCLGHGHSGIRQLQIRGT